MSKPIPVRLDTDLIRRLDAVALRIGSNRASVIRMLVQVWVDDFERRGRSSLPIDWEEIISATDGRRASAKVIPLSIAAETKDGAKDLPPRKRVKYTLKETKP